MKKQVVWGIMALCGLVSTGLAEIIYPQNNGFEVTNQVVAAKINYVSQTNTVTSPGWTLYGGGANSQLVAVVANGWVGLSGNNNITNRNSDGTTSTYGQAIMLRAGDGKYTNAALSSAYIAADFTLSQAYTNVTVQFDYRIRAAASGGIIHSWIVSTNGTVWDMGTKQQNTTNFVTFVSSGANIATNLTAGTYKLYLVGEAPSGGWSSSHAVMLDNVQINAIPEPARKLSLVIIN
jgi:hypothetical protein